jgi:amino acid adenylation domain-containing protein
MPMLMTKSNSTGLSEAKRALLARRLKGAGAALEESDRIQPRSGGSRIRISVDQYRIWLHHFIQPDLPTYNEPVSIFHAGPLDPAILKASLEAYVARHEAWRTSFQVHDGEVLQQVHPTLDVPMQFADLSALPEADREAEDNRLATVQAVKPFDLTEVPLLRVLHTRMSSEQDRVHLVVHHIVFDGSAIRDSLVPELAAIYAALAEGRKHDLPPREVQYADYAQWREAQLSSPSMQRSMAYWREELADDLPVIRLPFDRPRPSVVSQRGSMVSFTVPGELTGKLRDVGKLHGVSLYTTLLASLQVLLCRYSGHPDVVIGTGANGRRQPELQGMMGYILDTFPVRNHCSLEQPFSAFLNDVRLSLMKSLSAAEVPFDQIVQTAGIKRDPSYHPIFQTFFSFLPRETNAPVGWELQPKMVDTGTAKFDLYIEAEERELDTAACILYNTDIFDTATIDRMIGHWLTMLDAICVSPDTPLGELSLLTDAERALMLVTWNETSAELPATTMHDLFLAQVRRTPDAIAAVFEREALTYAQLNDRAERFAVLLRDAGAEPGTLIAICIDRSLNLLAGLLGILKTGAAYLPLDPGTPMSRIQLFFEDAEPVVLLTQAALVDQLSSGNAKVMTVEQMVLDAAALPAGSSVAEGAAGADSTAYIIHTSGSTGRPKAVELPHGAVVNLLLSMQREPGLVAADVLVAVTTISFDIAVLELFLPIAVGARVVIAPRTTALDPFELSDLMDECGCTAIQATPATWRGLMAIDWPGRPGMKVMCGGEALTRDLAEKLMSRKLVLWNMYGPTETTIWSTVRRVRNRQGTVPIGRPIANTTTYVLDAKQQPVPIGVAGELYIGGAGLAKGYRGQPKLTAEKFVTPEVAGGARIYRTGDYAVYRADGSIECQGRADNQVKVRGYRIELEEVELHLSAHPQIASAAACVWKDDAVGNRLAGYYVAKGGPGNDAAPDAREVRRFLQGRLPEYMIPTDLVALQVMPLTPNGKTDRKALTAPGDRPATRNEPADALTEDEQRLAAIWSDVLGVPSIGKYDNFFELGGHSLLLVVLFSRINKEFSLSLPITTIFDAQTLTSLTGVLQQKVRISSLVPVQTAGARLPLFMAHSYLLYYGLSSGLGEQQPFYGLRELETDGHLSIEERALRYVSDMRRVQPHGPYRIAGWCAAGPLAVEIARMLIQQGEKIGTVLLFDAWLPEYLAEMQKIERGRAYTRVARSKWKTFREKSKGLSLPSAFSYMWRTLRRAVMQKRDDFYIAHWTAVNQFSRRFHIPLPQFMHNTTYQTFAAMREFQPEMLPLHITLVRASESMHIAGANATCGWERVASEGVDVLWAPGDHQTMFRGAYLDVTSKLTQGALDARTPPPQ